MASYAEHLAQAKKNLQFLKYINQKVDNCTDWQITVSFYVAVHLINAYLAEKADFHYRSHEQIDGALNPAHQLSITKVSEDIYLAYRKLTNLSRRSRYLINDNIENKEIIAHYVSDKHLVRSLAQLDKIIDKIAIDYSERFDQIEMICDTLSNRNLKYFQPKRKQP